MIGNSKYAAILLTVLFAFFFQSGYAQNLTLHTDDSQENDPVQKSMRKIGEAVYYLQTLYIDSLDMDGLVDDMLEKAIQELDPHSAYIPAAEVAAMNEPLLGEFCGIGIEFAIISDTLTVQAVVSGGPAESAGMIAGDKIVAVDGQPIASCGLTVKDVHGYLRGEEGSKVSLDVRRRGEKSLLNFNITRGKIPLESVDAAYEAAPGVLYIKLGRFAMTSFQEFLAAFKEFGKKPDGLILDLRSNSGGYLHVALQIADQFLERGNMILYTEGRTVPRTEEYARGFGLYRKGRLAILVDENSASASEIVSGAVQDWDRGVIIGRRTFGKGLVQRAVDLYDGSQLRITLARYHTPSGRVIQAPYEKGHAEDYFRNHYERYNTGEFFGSDTLSFPDSLKYRTLKKGRTVYGGGGISPDIYVPIDTSYISPLYTSVIRGGYAIEFVNSWMDTGRNELKARYPDFSSFENSFDAGDGIMEDFLAFAKGKGLECRQQDLEVSSEAIELYLKALVAKGLYGMDSYFKVVNRDDKAFQEALKYVCAPVTD